MEIQNEDLDSNKDGHFNEESDYEENVIKILGTKRPKANTYSRIKNKLYNYLKFNLKRIVQFEFN